MCTRTMRLSSVAALQSDREQEVPRPLHRLTFGHCSRSSAPRLTTMRTNLSKWTHSAPSWLAFSFLLEFPLRFRFNDRFYLLVLCINCKSVLLFCYFCYCQNILINIIMILVVNIPGISIPLTNNNHIESLQ